VASVFFRGSRSAPRWYACFKAANGRWVSQRVRQETRREAMKIARALEAKAERQRFGLELPDVGVQLVGDLLKRWESGLTNRSAYDDRCRVRKWIAPRFGALRLADLTLPVLMAWLDEERLARRMSAGTLRHLLNVISRFFGWAIERGLATVNPVRQIPSGKRPQLAAKREVPWIEDDETVRRLMATLPPPFDLMFYVGNRAGMRLGEICGLRLSDVADLAAGSFRVRYSYLGPLKEDRHGRGKVKWTPAPGDSAQILGPWIARRRAAAPDDGEALLFPGADGFVLRKEHVEYRWEKAADALGLSLTWYEATRHSFASRNLSRGVALDEVAAALGHSTPAVTARHYAHFVRKQFSPLMTTALWPGPDGGGKVVAIAAARAPVSPTPARAPKAAKAVRRSSGKERGHAA
jgi:integrase